MNERALLEWLGKEEYSQYGECCGPALDGLIQKGLVRVHDGRTGQASFIAKGDSLAYRAVSLTPAGREALNFVNPDDVEEFP